MSKDIIVSNKKKIELPVILFYFSLIIFVLSVVVFFGYNITPGSLISICMACLDVVSIVVIIITFTILRNKIIDRAEKQREVLVKKNDRQYEILESMARIYTFVNYVDLQNMTTERFDLKDSIVEPLDLSANSHSGLNQSILDSIKEEHKDRFWSFTDLNSLPTRMTYEKIITNEFYHKTKGWFRASYIRIGDDVREPLKKVIYVVRNIDEEKKNIQQWINKSNTDELTGFYNRHAYEEDVLEMEKEGLKDNLIYVSMDVNSLKFVNDSMGHEAGDEIILGACQCMERCFGPYGKLYRTGGDEFAALIFADSYQLELIKKDFSYVTNNWHGQHINNVAISCGYVLRKDVPEMTLHDMAVLADKKMYEDKSEYYRTKGIDRRGQSKDYSVLKNKIVKLNISEDTFRVLECTDKSDMIVIDLEKES